MNVNMIKSGLFMIYCARSILMCIHFKLQYKTELFNSVIVCKSKPR